MKRPPFAALACAVCTPLATAQSAPPPPPAAVTATAETVPLSPFEVQENAGSGYATTSSVTVSRLATRNTELPLSAITINQQMIADTLAVGAEETFNLVSGLYLGNAGTGNQENNTYSLRGYTASSAQRDGVDDSLFTSSGGFDYSLVESIEVMKGPNGILYGAQANPGGVVNIVSKRPRARPFTKLTAMAGSFGFWRGELDASHHLDRRRRFGFRVSGAVSNNRGPVDWPGDPRLGYRGINSSVNFRGPAGLEVWFWTGFVRDSSSRAKYMTRAFATTAPRSATVAGEAGVPIFDRAFIDGGAGQNLLHAYTRVNTDTYEAGASRTLKFGPVSLDSRLIGRYRHQLSDGSRVRGIGNDTFVDRAGAIIGPANSVDNRFVNFSLVQDGRIGGVYRTGLRYDFRPTVRKDHNYALDLNANVPLGPLHSQTLLTATTTSGTVFAINSTYDITTPAVLQSLGYQVVGNTPRVWLYPVSSVVSGIDRDVVLARNNIRALNGTTFTTSEVYGVGVLERLSALDRRVVLMGGVRRSHTESKIATTNAAGVFGAYALREGDRDSPGIAGLVKFFKDERSEGIVYANFNRTFIPVFTVDQRLATIGQKFPDRIASTKEYGVKLDLFRSRVVATVSTFDNEESNVLRPQIDTDGSVTGVRDRTYSAPIGARTTKGFEGDLNFKLFGGLEAVLGYSTQKARLDSGIRPEAIPNGTASALVTHRWRAGALKHFSATYIYNRWGSFLLGGGRTTWLVEGGAQHALALGYRWRNTDLRLRVSNLLDVRDAQPSTFDTAIGVTNPRSYRLGVTTNF
ncbi:MAG: TonB-dependent receptor plug domain-containing protein [Opitutaceae bacterium]|nr:TonB-dependent receptor plug domain-containing protein [Opitutaceae bacterium]